MSGRCGAQAKAISNMMGLMALATGTPEERVDINTTQYERVRWPRNGACAGCETDASVKRAVLRCSGCKATQYCGVECQKVSSPVETYHNSVLIGGLLG